jgi:hypothetical protein
MTVKITAADIDDMLQLTWPGGETTNVKLVNADLDWPPPKTFTMAGVTWEMVSCSVITDEQRATMTHVYRGAAYVGRYIVVGLGGQDG